MKVRKVPVEAILPLALSTVAVLGVLPFAVIRFANGDWMMAGVDTIIPRCFRTAAAADPVRQPVDRNPVRGWSADHGLYSR
jgi:hypothetical protein